MTDVAIRSLNRIGLERRDGRNLLLTAGIMALLLFGYADGSLGTRIVAGLLGGIVSAVVFVVVTVVINAYKPDHW